jgi:hypothetical protein
VWLAPVDKQPQENGPCQILQLSSNLFWHLMNDIHIYKRGDMADFEMDEIAEVGMQFWNRPTSSIEPKAGRTCEHRPGLSEEDALTQFVLLQTYALKVRFKKGVLQKASNTWHCSLEENNLIILIETCMVLEMCENASL